jgi:hypothetical protein
MSRSFIVFSPGLLCSIAAAVLAACSAPAEATAGEVGEDAGLRAAGAAHAPEPSASPCALERGQPSPSTVLEVAQRVNQLPHPVTLPCFVESLARPLELNATESLISAQPAVGRRSPRLFIFVDPLIMSISFDGVGSHLLELGELREGATRALRAEIAFPVEGEMSREAPFERIVFLERLTTCGGCHADERPALDVTFTQAFDNRALRPLERERVSLESLVRELGRCDPAREPDRCALLEAVFGAGTVVDREFPTTMATFY